MTSDTAQNPPPAARFPAHDGAAILALGGALALQTVWPEIVRRDPVDSWWPYDGVVLAAATGYLFATAWLHLGAARWAPGELLPRLWQVGRGLVADIAVAAFVGVLFLSGPESSTLRAGLWLIPPVLLTVSVASAATCALSLRDGSRRLASEASPSRGSPRRHYRDLVRTLLAVLLLGSMVALERHVPDVKPWEVPPTRSAGQSSHAVDHHELRLRAIRLEKLHLELRGGPIGHLHAERQRVLAGGK